MSIWKQKSRILVTCPKGVVNYLKTEIDALNFPVLQEMETAIQTEGTLEDTMLLNLHLRTASRILYQLQTFKVISPGALYERVYALRWEDLLSGTGDKSYVCITSVVDNSLINDSRFVNVKVKDAIVDRIREKRGTRPNSGPDRSKAVVHVYWRQDQAFIYIDTSGERLSLRGYRRIPLQAPMQEILAAAVIMASGWRGRGAFVNPMCGSGTLAIEAALIALGRAPGLSRRNFGFMHIAGFETGLWNDLRRKAHQSAMKKLPAKIIASDIDEAALRAARLNAQTAGVDHLIEFQVCSYENTPVPDGGGVIMINPPYGERLDAETPELRFSASRKETSHGRAVIIRKAAPEKEGNNKLNALQKLEALYGGIGDFLKNVGGGWRGYIFTGNLEMAKSVGLRTKRRMMFYNGEIECRLLEYELYAGSRKSPLS